MKKVYLWIVSGLFLLAALAAGFLLFINLMKEPTGVGHGIIRTRFTLKELHTAVQMFKMDTGRYPSQEKGLIELVEKPDDVSGWPVGGYLENTVIPKDSWGSEFVYVSMPEGNQPFVIISYGADGIPGGTGEDADIYSTDID